MRWASSLSFRRVKHIERIPAFPYGATQGGDASVRRGDMMQTMTFDEWRRNNRDLEVQFVKDVEEDGGVDCPHCDGSGTLEEATQDMRYHHMRNLFDVQLKDDTKKLAAWNQAIGELAEKT